MYLAERLDRGSAPSPGSRAGMPVGGDLEYADEVTLIRALQGRRASSVSNLVIEILLRLAKSCWRRCSASSSISSPPAVRARRVVELALLAWLSGAAFILLVEIAARSERARLARRSCSLRARHHLGRLVRRGA